MNNNKVEVFVEPNQDRERVMVFIDNHVKKNWELCVCSYNTCDLLLTRDHKLETREELGIW